MIVLHYTGMESGGAALERLRDPGAKVSAHYMVEEDGRVYCLVDEARRAWHAGLSRWLGEADINGRSIGVEIVNPGHEFGYRPFPAAQIDAVTALISEIRDRWTIADSLILGHSDVAPRRKQDPGELFPWKALAAAGHGLWIESGPAPGAALAPGAEGLAVLALRGALARLGYDVEAQGPFDDDLALVVTAFQRHWVQTRCDGVADGETRSRLMALLRLAGPGA
jgi:N-acetylmuramoyl-L-alanine amidase